MQEIWREDPEERPDFRGIVLSLTDLVHYSGDIESDLKAETRNCKKEHTYHQLEPSAFSQHLQETGASIYAVLEEPVYHNFSREESLDSPEEYEVPQTISSACDGGSGKTVEDLGDAYEVPVLSTQDGESAKSVVADSAIGSMPVEYEIPQSETTKNALPDGGSSPQHRPGHFPQRSSVHQDMTKKALANGGSSPRPGHFPENPPANQAASNGISPRADQKSPAHRKKLPTTSRPNHSPRRSPARRHKTATGPINIPSATRDGEVVGHEMLPSSAKRGERAISPGYLKLNYPAMQKAVSVPPSSANSVSTSDKPYSTLEWKKGKAVTSSTNFNSLPHQFTLKDHIYQTLEPNNSQ